VPFEDGFAANHPADDPGSMCVMSRDIYIQDIPENAVSVDDIPDDWEPRPLPFGRREIIEAVTDLVPSADFSDPSWAHVEFPGVDIEVSVPDESPLNSFALHVRTSDTATADRFIAALLGRLQVRAFDPEGAPETGIFGSP
jgi:hypothetical protein